MPQFTVRSKHPTCLFVYECALACLFTLADPKWKADVKHPPRLPKFSLDCCPVDLNFLLRMFNIPFPLCLFPQTWALSIQSGHLPWLFQEGNTLRKRQFATFLLIKYCTLIIAFIPLQFLLDTEHTILVSFHDSIWDGRKSGRQSLSKKGVCDLGPSHRPPCLSFFSCHMKLTTVGSPV